MNMLRSIKRTIRVAESTSPVSELLFELNYVDSSNWFKYFSELYHRNRIITY